MRHFTRSAHGIRRAAVLVAGLAVILATSGIAATAGTDEHGTGRGATADTGVMARHSGAGGNPIPVVAHRPALPSTTPRFSVSLPDIPSWSTFGKANLLSGFGCTGGDLSPAITWHGAPAGTKSYLITLFDEDAPTSAGFWHWVVWNIPATTHSLPEGAGTDGQPGLPGGAVSGITDFGTVLPSGYEGPCPPPGDRAHRYVFSVIALSVDDLSALGVPANLPAAGLMNVIRGYAVGVGYHTVYLKR